MRLMETVPGNTTTYASPPPILAAATGVRRSILPGGVRLLTQTDRSVRSASIGLWLPVGSRDERPEHAGLGAGRHASRRRRAREEAAIGRVRAAVRAGLVGTQRRERAVEAAERRRHQRSFRMEAGVRDRVARREIVGAVRHEVVAGRVAGLLGLPGLLAGGVGVHVDAGGG